MKKFLKIAVVSETTPDTSHGGGAVTVDGIIKSLQACNAIVEIVAIDRLANVAEKKQGGIQKRLRVLKEKLQSLFIGKKTFFEISTTKEQKKEAEALLKKKKYDCLVCYHWKSIDLVKNIKTLPIIGLVGDPFDMPIMLRLKMFQKHAPIYKKLGNNFKSTLISLTYRSAKHAMIELLNKCSISGAFAAHHALEFRNAGALNCLYIRTPIKIRSPIKQTRQCKKTKFTLVHIGHFHGTATLSGIELLCQEVFPSLDKEIGIENFQVKMIGDSENKIPTYLKEKLVTYNTKFLGKKTQISNELQNADVVIVPTPIYLGIRVRICTALAHGCCVVTHIANTAGIPELMDSVNCLIGVNGNDFCDKIISAYKNPSLRKKIQKGALKTYKNYFCHEKAGRSIYELCEKAIFEHPTLMTEDN